MPKSLSPLEVAQVATPADPPAGSTLIYPKTDGLWYTKSPAGVESRLVSSVGDETIAGNKTFTGDLEVPRMVITPSTGTAKSRFGGLTGIAAWVGMFLNSSFNGTAWILDDVSKDGWALKLDARAGNSDFSAYRMAAGTNPRAAVLMFKVDTTGLMTVTGRITGVSNATGSTDALPKGQADGLYATITNLALKAPIASPTFTGTVAGITKAMVGLTNAADTTDAGKPVSTAQQTALDLKANLASPTFTGTVSGVTKAMVGLTNAADTTDAGKPVSTAQQAALDLKAPLASPTFTGTVAGVTKTHVGLANVDNTTDAGKPVSTAQAAADALKANLASPTFTGTVAGVTATHVGLGNVTNTSDAAKPVSTAQQTALDLKAPLASPTFTGTVAGITKAMVGLTNAADTTDAAKPVSTAQQTALDLKANLASPTFTGTVGGVTKAMVGLTNAADTTDAGKPVSTAQQTALDLKANAASPAFTGTPTGITAAHVGAASSKLGGAETKAAASATTGATTLDCSAASVFSVTPTGNITGVTLSNPPATGTACTITFIVNQGATARTVATPTGGVFIGAATPTQVINKTCIFTYLTVDGGTTWYCSAAVQV